RRCGLELTQGGVEFPCLRAGRGLPRGYGDIGGPAELAAGVKARLLDIRATQLEVLLPHVGVEVDEGGGMECGVVATRRIDEVDMKIVQVGEHRGDDLI